MSRRHGKSAVPDPAVFPTRPYDLVKEFTIALVAVAVLTAALAAVFSSPDVKPVTLASWSRADGADFTVTAAAELGGTSGTAEYGPPYNHTPNAAQKLGPVGLQGAAGVRTPVDTAEEFVLGPLTDAPEPPDVSAALAAWNAAPASRQQAWTKAYSDALTKSPGGDPAKVAEGDYGPVPVLTARLLDLAKSGSLDGELQAGGKFYQTDYTSPLLFLSDGSYLESLARAEHLGGDQWGMMNETGNYPGQAWLWLYTFWYQIEPFKSSGNADALIWGLMALLSLGLVLVPFIPGVRSIPRWTRVHRLIWRSYYRDQNASVKARKSGG
ncbi:hypothetical protein [Streptomyces sp. HUAS TT20]|uniref:hypothetical protein n=1 Tax=Streptomyces sp. HUAS TT20 TaxID=3447509 RepID=UPI0021D7D903|nr:hypothetical protein [Streptomyces sp. HUAS 15-9]UXY32107.1 hypothetical protein N8I87_39905 [Streptomyces sp. HUAS 15-9]